MRVHKKVTLPKMCIKHKIVGSVRENFNSLTEVITTSYSVSIRDNITKNKDKS